MASRQSADAAVAEKQSVKPDRQVNRGKETLRRVLHGLVILSSIIGIATAAALLAMTPSITVQRYNEDSGLIETVIGAAALAIVSTTARYYITTGCT